jgi:hypothetical protein
MTKDAASQACLISLTSLKEWREDSGIASVGRMAPLSDQDCYHHDSSQTGQLAVRAKGNETACAGGQLFVDSLLALVSMLLQSPSIDR